MRTPLVATVDADTLLMPSALRRIVARLLISPPDTVAVAGAVFVRNSRNNFITRAQEWDYFLGIASVKRQQGLFQGTMVAQGAFSVYRAAALKEVGGWPDRIGEDIVLTWAMMREGGRVGYERTAIAFTGAPEDAQELRPAAAALGAGDDRGAARARRCPACRRAAPTSTRSSSTSSSPTSTSSTRSPFRSGSSWRCSATSRSSAR